MGEFFDGICHAISPDSTKNVEMESCQIFQHVSVFGLILLVVSCRVVVYGYVVSLCICVSVSFTFVLLPKRLTHGCSFP